MSNMVPVINGRRAIGNPTINSLDGKTRAPLRTLMADSFTDAERAEYGLYLVDTTPPEGKQWTGAFTGAPPVAVFEDVPPPFSTADVAKAAMVQWIDALTEAIMATYPKSVQARWQIEEAAARAVKAGTADAAQTALVADEGAAKDRTPEEHADAIIANADRFNAIVGQINALFLETDKALDEAAGPEDYVTILDAAKAKAAPLAAAYGLG